MATEPCVSASIEVPEAVRRKAVAVGAEGERWLRELGRIVAELEAEWGLQVGKAITGGSGGFVANAVTADGGEAVLKIAIPDGLEGHSPFAKELQVLLLGDGQGYVRVIRADVDHRAMLLEQLGRPLSALGLSVDAQIDIITATLMRVWRPHARRNDAASCTTGAQQAQGLIGVHRGATGRGSVGRVRGGPSTAPSRSLSPVTTRSKLPPR